MFLQFKKITDNNRVGNASVLTDLIVNENALFLFNTDNWLKNSNTGLNYQATRVEISSSPNYSFYTPSTEANIASVLNIVDVTAGAGTGSQCLSSPGVLDTLTLSSTFPWLRANMLRNNSKWELESYIFNPQYIVYAEEISYFDMHYKTTDVCTMIVLRGSQQRRFMTNLAFVDLQAILEPISVPV